MAKRKSKKRPFVLITVSGGVASAYSRNGAEVVLIDWDQWDGQLPTREEIQFLYEEAMSIPDRALREAVQGDIEELEGKGVSEDEE